MLKLKILFLTLLAIVKERYWINPLIPLAVFHHETGNFTSNIFKENNNVAGMKASTVRTNHKGTNRGHATYNSIWKSILDYFQRQKQFKIKPSKIESYMFDTQLSGYAEDKYYITKVITMYNQIKPEYRLVFFLIFPTLFYITYLAIQHFKK